MNKESLKKHQFWYLLGGFLLIWMILWLCAFTNSSTASEEKQKQVETTKKQFKDWANKRPKNDRFIQPWRDYGKAFADQKDDVWNKAWDTQKDLYEWPRGTTDFNTEMLYAAETKKLSLDKRSEYKLLYPKQFEGLTATVAPATFLNGDGEAGFNTLMGPTLAANVGSVPGSRGSPTTPSGVGAEGISFLAVFAAEKGEPTPEEMWIAQEDFWVKRELLNIVHTTQQTVGRFKRVEIKKDAKETPLGTEKTYRFDNGVWEFTFYVEKGKDATHHVLSAASTIKNVSATHAVQALASAHGSKGLVFWLTQGANKYKLEIAGEPLAYDAVRKLDKARPVDTLDLTQDFGMEQEFDWSNAPVRQINALRTARHSHRTAKATLVQNPIFKDEPALPGAPPPQPAAPSTVPVTTGDGNPFATPLLSATPYGLERNRYIMATEQARHLPVAMVLIVEQAHINDVLIAVANSPFRIQTTQVAFQQATNIKPPRDPMGDVKPSFTSPRGSSSGQPSAAEEEFAPNLVELTVYGIATLYERPKAKETKPAVATPVVPPVGK